MEFFTDLKKIMRIRNKKSGFSIFGVLFSVSIIAIGFMAILSLFSTILKVEKPGNQMSVAMGLAQEGIELVRNIRDSNWKNGYPPFGDVVLGGVIINDGNSWNIDFTMINLEDRDDRLFLREVGGAKEFVHTATVEPSIFLRWVTISSVWDPDALVIPPIQYKRVVSHVRWYDRGKQYDIELEDHLYPWR